jgi:hypothetical protein
MRFNLHILATIAMEIYGQMGDSTMFQMELYGHIPIKCSLNINSGWLWTNGDFETNLDGILQTWKPQV